MLVRSSEVRFRSPNFMSPKSTLGTLRVTVGPCTKITRRANCIEQRPQGYSSRRVAMISTSIYLEGDLYGQGDRFRMVLYAANQAGHKSRRFGSIYKKVDVEALVFLYIHKTTFLYSCRVKKSGKRLFLCRSCNRPILPLEGSTSIVCQSLLFSSHWKLMKVLLWFHIWQNKQKRLEKLSL